ncbi:unnamed protein product [Euphydryas editha]|uniref:Uncharacterized protein n=1 Tax=Euphydryas editha TaxID=104508 RepID=A0AAU9UBR7_EUPED|nr:unnamed protein product [Euphydryas editha]
MRIVLKRLPVSMRAGFEQEHARDEASSLPTFDQLLTFLEDECRMGDIMVTDTPVELSGPGPRLESRNPRYGRSRRYESPTMARGSRHRAEVEFSSLPHFDAPSRDSGVRSPPRQH